MLGPGSQLTPTIRLVRPLQQGGMGSVWVAYHLRLATQVVVKFMSDALLTTEVAAARFSREAAAAAQVKSPHVVQMLDFGVNEGKVPYIVMELLEGETLADRLDRVRVLPSPQACRILSEVAKAAAKAHDAGIVHRDLKPANVFLVRGDGVDDELAKVFDFGIAKVEPTSGSKTGATQAGTLLGTPQYMSPEQAAGKPVDFRTDLYAMGIIAFECMTGRLPFDTDDMMEVLGLAACGKLLRPSSVAPVPRAFDLWFGKATALDPGQRFASAKDLAGALKTCILR